MKKYLFIIFIFTIILNTGCEKFTQGLVVELDIPEHEPVLTPYCFINDADTSILVILQKSQGALEDAETGYIDNATVELYKNGTFWNTIPYNSSDTTLNSGVYELPMDAAFANEGYGDSYELRVSAPDFETTSATQIMPTPISIKEVQFSNNAGVSQFGNLQHNLKVVFDDPKDEENYYIIHVNSQYFVLNDGDTISNTTTYGTGPFTTNPSVEQGYGGSVIISDKLFDGQTYSADLGIYQYFGNQGVDLDLTAFFKITLLSVTRDEYLYQKSLITYSNSSNSLFAEPTLLHTNMDNGLGVFSMMSADTIEEEFEY